MYWAPKDKVVVLIKPDDNSTTEDLIDILGRDDASMRIPVYAVVDITPCRQGISLQQLKLLIRNNLLARITLDFGPMSYPVILYAILMIPHLTLK